MTDMLLRGVDASRINASDGFSRSVATSTLARLEGLTKLIWLAQYSATVQSAHSLSDKELQLPSLPWSESIFT